jgi:hypothetical protein
VQPALSNGVYNTLNLQYGDESVAYSKISVSASEFYFDAEGYRDAF